LARTCSNANASPLTDSTPEAERLSPPAHLKAEALLSSGSCFVSQATKRLAQTRFNKHDCVATGRARCAIRGRGAIWHSGPKNTPLFAPTRGRFLWRAFKNFVSLIWRATSAISFTSLHFKKRNTGTLRPHPHFLCYEHSGHGMVHDTQLSAVSRAIRSCSYRRYAGGQSTSSAIARKRSNLFARSSISFVTGSSI